MARTRVFISSTFFDLRQVREDVSRFVKDMGHEPVLFERGDVPYGSKDPLESYCYKEIALSDILVSVVGGRFGTQAAGGNYSISQRELKHALQRGKQVYVFVDKRVHAEYQTWKPNRELKGIKWQYVDNTKVFEFMEELHALPFNNPIFEFESASDIVSILREQWSGLFQRLLEEDNTRPQLELVNTLKNTVATLQKAVDLLTDNNQLPEQLLMLGHPAYARVRDLLHIPYRVIFLTDDELDRLLRANGWHTLPNAPFEDLPKGPRNWAKYLDNDLLSFTVADHLFEVSGKLKVIDSQEWRDDWIQIRMESLSKANSDDDEIPF